VPKPSSEMEKLWTRASDMAGAPSILGGQFSWVVRKRRRKPPRHALIFARACTRHKRKDGQSHGCVAATRPDGLKPAPRPAPGSRGSPNVRPCPYSYVAQTADEGPDGFALVGLWDDVLAFVVGWVEARHELLEMALGHREGVSVTAGISPLETRTKHVVRGMEVEKLPIGP
jgi:hypothetical protein